MKWYLNIVLVHIFLITNEDKQLFLFIDDLCFLFCEMPAYAFIFQLTCFSDLKFIKIFIYSCASYVYCLTAPNSTFSTCSAIMNWLPCIFFFTVSVMLTFSIGFSYWSWYGVFHTFFLLLGCLAVWVCKNNKWCCAPAIYLYSIYPLASM